VTEHRIFKRTSVLHHVSRELVLKANYELKFELKEVALCLSGAGDVPCETGTSSLCEALTSQKKEVKEEETQNIMRRRERECDAE
jgi:hypothetical protein